MNGEGYCKSAWLRTIPSKTKKELIQKSRFYRGTESSRSNDGSLMGSMYGGRGGRVMIKDGSSGYWEMACARL